VGIAQVSEDDEILLITKDGKILRTRARDISVQGRNTQGVRLLETEGGDKGVSLARVVERDDIKDTSPEPGPAEAPPAELPPAAGNA
jgi:DNA gyrase subunit A